MALLATDASRPDVVVCLCDHLAFVGLMALKAAGLSVPGEIGVVGFTARHISGVLPCPLTALHRPHHWMGMTGARTILARIHRTGPERAVCPKGRIVPGATNPPPVRAKGPPCAIPRR